MNNMLYSIGFGIYPLCNPRAPFYDFFFEHREIGYLVPQLAFWPFSTAVNDPIQFESCKTEICEALIKYLLPYFEEYHNCERASNGIPEFRGFDGKDYNAIFFALKAGKKSDALIGMQDLRQQNQEAVKNVAQHMVLTPEYLEDFHRKDAELLHLYNFILLASDKEISLYLEQNEQRAVQFLSSSM